jgi:protein-export membrane protein SecD
MLLALVVGLISYPQVTVKIPKVYDVLNKLKINLGLDLQGGIHMEYKADTSQVESSKVGEAMQAVQDVIERRVNAFGVAEPVIYTTKSGNEQRLVVELAGVKDINEAKNLIQETPFLEFKEEGQAPEADPEKKKEEGKGGDLGFVKKGMLVPQFDQVLFDGNLKDGEVYSQIVETDFGWHIIKKIEQQGEGDSLEVHAAHILFAKQNDPGSDNKIPQEALDKINEQAKARAGQILEKALTGEDFAKLANENTQDPGNNPQSQNENYVSTGLTGKNLKSAKVDFPNQTLSEPVVSLQFDDEGTKLFAEITKRNVGKTVAIYLDNKIVSTPRVNEEISTGTAQISGNFTTAEAKDLVRKLNEGALPVPISLVSQQSVEASLGQVSLEKSLKAGMIGLAIVIVFMLLYYRFLGLIASVALLIYTALMVSIFKLSGYTPWQITLTLPGIAGFILSIGMAVDANILIFERTKEEIKRGRHAFSAIEEGFKRAWTSIRDGNVSSIITSVILITLGSGFIKGFAVTLIIGVLVSMFTAVTVSRVLLKFLVGEWIENHLWMIGVKRSEVASPDTR